MTSIYPYQTREVRDLAWACFSPPLLLTRQLDDGQSGAANNPLSLTRQRQAWLQGLDRDAMPLLEHLAQQRSHRLGVYFEHLWHFFLAEDPATELLAHNLPVREQGKTLGEFDCLYYCHQRRQHIHLELAVKFFLSHRQDTGCGEASHRHEWLGPNTADRLDLKVNHLMQRQIRLADRPAAHDALLALGIGELAREVEIKGYLFQSLADPLPPPRGFSPQHRLETWLDIGQLEHFLVDKSARYQPLPRAQWLSGAQLSPGEAALDSKQLTTLLREHLLADPRPQLVAALGPDGLETLRFFVTRPDWPATPRGN